MDIKDLEILPQEIIDKIISIHFRAIHEDKFKNCLASIKIFGKPRVMSIFMFSEYYFVDDA